MHILTNIQDRWWVVRDNSEDKKNLETKITLEIKEIELLLKISDDILSRSTVIQFWELTK